MTRKLTVDKHEGQRVIDKYRASRSHQTNHQAYQHCGGTLPSHSSLPAQQVVQRTESTALSRQDMYRRPVQVMRKGSRGSSKTDEDEYASPQDLVRQNGHPEMRERLPGTESRIPDTNNRIPVADDGLSPVYDRISPSSSGFCSGMPTFIDARTSLEPTISLNP